MKPTHAFAAATLLLMSAGPAAHAEVVDLVWDVRQKVQRQFTVAPGKFVELCGKLARGTRVQWRFEGDGPTDFNVHYHEGKDVRFPAREDDSVKAQGVLDAAVDHDYCWMWTNKSKQPVHVSVELTKAPA